MAGQYHEPRESLSEHTKDVKRAIDSIMEELEAVDWYRQRVEAAQDPELRAILHHHQREEVEHFSMLLEWLRRNDPDFAQQLQGYLFTERPILEVEEALEEANGTAAAEESAPQPSAPTAHERTEPLVARRVPYRRTIGSMKEGA